MPITQKTQYGLIFGVIICLIIALIAIIVGFADTDESGNPNYTALWISLGALVVSIIFGLIIKFTNVKKTKQEEENETYQRDNPTIHNIGKNVNPGNYTNSAYKYIKSFK